MSDVIDLPVTLTAKEAAPLMRLSHWTVSQLMRSGKLGHYLIKGKRLTTQAHIVEYFHQNEVKTSCLRAGSDSADTATDSIGSHVDPAPAARFTDANTNKPLDKSAELASALRTLTTPSDG